MYWNLLKHESYEWIVRQAFLRIDIELFLHFCGQLFLREYFNSRYFLEIFEEQGVTFLN